MNDQPYFPEVSDPDTYVDGKLVPPVLVRAVTRGWKAGLVYLVFCAFGFALGLYLEPPSSVTSFLPLLELPVIAALVFGVRRWYLPAAALLVLHPILSTLLLAMAGPSTVPPHSQGGLLRVVFLVVFLYAFANAARAIYRFRRL